MSPFFAGLMPQRWDIFHAAGYEWFVDCQAEPNLSLLTAGSRFAVVRDDPLPAYGLIWSLSSRLFLFLFIGKRPGVMRHKSAAATMDQTDIRGLVTTVHRSVMEAASL